jgi:hypothetical protein
VRGVCGGTRSQAAKLERRGVGHRAHATSCRQPCAHARTAALPVLASLDVSAHDVCGATPEGGFDCQVTIVGVADPLVNGFDFGSPITDVSVGGRASCALLADGAVRCWGSSSMAGMPASGPYCCRGHGQHRRRRDPGRGAAARAWPVGVRCRRRSKRDLRGAGRRLGSMLGLAWHRNTGASRARRLDRRVDVCTGGLARACAGRHGGAQLRVCAGRIGAVYCWGQLGVLGYGHERVYGLDPTVTAIEPVPVLDPACAE